MDMPNRKVELTVCNPRGGPEAAPMAPPSPRLQNLSEQIGPVGDDDIHPLAHQLPHSPRIIHSPGVHAIAMLRRPGHVSVIDLAVVGMESVEPKQVTRPGPA